ncbi:MAG: response regulator [Emcibacter sp.]|nr:response regulator [Emcibacter sp.]
MNSTTKSIDYPYLITIGGIGLLAALAGVIVGFALGKFMLGYLLAVGCLVSVAFIIGRILYKENNLSAGDQKSLSITKLIQPQVITTLDGTLVYCNMPYRYFMKDSLAREVMSPLDVMEKEHAAAVKEVLFALDKGREKTNIVQLISGKNEKIYIEVTLSRKIGQDDYINWILAKSSPEVPMEINQKRENGFKLEQLGMILDRCDSGLVALSGEGQIIYANDIFLHWLTGQSTNDLHLPAALTDFCPVPPENISGQFLLKTMSGDDVLLEFVPLEKAQENLDNMFLSTGDKNSSNLLSHKIIVYQVFSCQSEAMIGEEGADTVNIDRFFRESPIGIAIVTKQGEVLERNNVFQEYMQELDIKNMRNIRHIVDPDEYEEFYVSMNKTLDTGEASSLSSVGFKGKGGKHGHIYITRLNKFSGHEKAAILYLIDMTEQKNLELQFAQSQKMQAVGQLAGGIAHDFNNLLTAIIGFSDLLLVRHGPGDQSFSDIIQIKQNANRAANLVRQLLAFSRQQTLRPKVLVITDILAELSNLLGRLIGDNIALEITHGRNLEHVKVDQGQIEQVIINLCVNARDAMDNMGKISIRTRNITFEESKKLNNIYQVMPPNEYVLLEVEDTGCGIAKEHMDKIFEPFFSTKEVGKGTGLGLSTVYGIVKQTDGFVFCSSEVDKGTTFSIYIPAYKVAPKENTTIIEQEVEEEAVTRDLTGRETILLVEDEDPVRMFASRALRNKGYNVYEANSGEAALALFKENEAELDLLISDVVMPIMDGPSLVRKIRETNKKLKVIFISGYAEDAFDKSSGDEDFHFLPKPFSLKQLAEQVKEVLESN